MIVSHKYEFIFIKTAKTAGTSIEMALSKFCGPDDIITPLHETDEKDRSAAGDRGAQNCWAPLRRYAGKDLARLVVRQERKLEYHAHMSAGAVKAKLGDATWRRYLTFCVERNPFDRIISSYYWRQGAVGYRRSLSEFVARRADIPKRRGWDLYTIDGEIAVDRILRYESLDAELADVGAVVGLPGPLDLPHAKATHRTDRRPYREVLAEEDRAVIEAVYADELRVFGYTF